jgi:hypothetical protein
MVCHPDEFCYHDPRKIAMKAEAEGYDSVAWYSCHFLPHSNDLRSWEKFKKLPVQERVRYYHWGYRTSELPWRENRLYRNGPGVMWDRSTHGSTEPHGLKQRAPWYPILMHYKCYSTDMDEYEPTPENTLFKHHWRGLEHRTGLAYSVKQFEDFFVSSYPGYDHCDKFEGKFDHSWNMGEAYR